MFISKILIVMWLKHIYNKKVKISEMLTEVQHIMFKVRGYKNKLYRSLNQISLKINFLNICHSMLIKFAHYKNTEK